jgi:hypothetical protein
MKALRCSKIINMSIVKRNINLPDIDNSLYKLVSHISYVETYILLISPSSRTAMSFYHKEQAVVC